MTLNGQLQTLGLNEKEAKIYLAALELGQTSIQDIAKKAKIKRSTVYEIMDNLINQGLINIIPKGKKRYFIAAEPKKLDEIIKQKQQTLSKIMPELEALSKVSPIKPKIRFYEGAEGLKTVYKDTLTSKTGLLAFSSVTTALENKEMKDFLLNYYVIERAKRKIYGKAITPDTALGINLKKEDKRSFRETKLIPHKDYPFTIEINIYGNKVALTSFKENELMGVIIESKEISNTMRSIHKFFWNNIK